MVKYIKIYYRRKSSNMDPASNMDTCIFLEVKRCIIAAMNDISRIIKIVRPTSWSVMQDGEEDSEMIVFSFSLKVMQVKGFCPMPVVRPSFYNSESSTRCARL